MKDKFSKLLDVKSIVTVVLTLAMVALLFVQHEPPREMTALFSTVYGAVITYFFTKKSKEDNEK